ncbi:DUF6268 family outer membrane beta-barrel protein [Patiriisocius hiemis]|uniref:DUF6268 family outer membrane beta-barrel protein n=1 Tax=Patiriisocius hiemis TaxID=3075604 RepID=A0ABU2YB94_9FLAO|nr:DUF6268 family outer membrane beta-barrel protein [Constantimarinum sp. W242]MDT0555466.1 DUF6268 family outer membrane beta-barrel protein [Constantimarinum sp. W242]
MKKILFFLLFVPAIVVGQDYVDLLKIGYGQTFNNDFVDTEESTFVKSFEADLTIPVVLNDNHALITGAVFSRNNLQLFPEASFTSLYSTILKVGLASTYNEKWSSTLVLLPKIASDYNEITGDDFYFGGVALLKYQKNEHLKYRFGLYASSEAFGIFSTPIFGWYYLSPNSKFEMDVSLPISTDINYTSGSITYGLDYYGIGRSFRLYNEEGVSESYVDLASLEFASYIQFNALQKSVLLRAKFGYSSNNYEIYPDGQTIDLGLSAFAFGDNRTQLNPDISGGFFVKFEAVYRFNITSSEEEKTKEE